MIKSEMTPSEQPHLKDLTLKSIKIDGFRGTDKSIHIELNRYSNFLIGQNGTGKTTLINIISDCLMCRYQSLMNAPFDSAEIHFQHEDKHHDPRLLVSKSYDEIGYIKSISFTFWEYKTKDDPAFHFEITSRLHRRPDEFSGMAMQRRMQNEFSKRFKLTWLALNRSTGLAEKTTEGFNDLNSKLEHTLQRLSTYFTKLDSEYALEMQKFQQEWFMSLLVTKKRTALDWVVRDLDADMEGEQIREMLSGIGISESIYAPKVEKHVRTIKKVHHTNTQKVTDSDIISHITDSYDIQKLHVLVGQWEELQEVRNKIYATKTKFIEIANSMLFQKELKVDSGNTITATKIQKETHSKNKRIEAQIHRRDSTTGRIIKPGEITHADLSSGEKQLLIFLGETALRSEITYIFIADEPELSLHIEWQEKLVPVILELSPMAQVFFATHSPDITIDEGNNVFSMEKFLA